jgi:hypothetical protein
MFAQSKSETKSEAKPTDKRIELKFEVKGDGADKKLEELEQKLQMLLKEIHVLRSGKSGAAPAIKSDLTPKVMAIKGAPAAEKKDVIVKVVPEGKIVEEKNVIVTVDPKTGQKNVVVRVNPDGTKAVEEKRVIVAQVEDGKTKPTEEKRVIVLDKAAVGTVPGQGQFRMATLHAGGSGDSVSLTRSTYQLTAAGAKALNDFLGSNCKAKVLETKVEGDKITVTTTPDVQHAIAGMVALMQGKSPGYGAAQFFMAPGAPASGPSFQWGYAPATGAKTADPAKKPSEPAKPVKPAK